MARGGYFGRALAADGGTAGASVLPLPERVSGKLTGHDDRGARCLRIRLGS